MTRSAGTSAPRLSRRRVVPRASWRPTAPALALLAASCGSGSRADGGTEAGADAAREASRPASDAAYDAARATLDAADAVDGTDGAAGADAGGLDAAVDARAIDAGPAHLRQTARPLGSTSAPSGFYEYLPPGYGDGVPRPLLVFWHGSGEDGDGRGGTPGTDGGLPRVLNHGPPHEIALDAWPSSRPFIVLSPQYTVIGACPPSTTVAAFFAWALAHYDVDPRRVYLTGLSCGSIAAWQYVRDHLDETVAAAVLLSGDPGSPTTSGSAWGVRHCDLGRVAIWAFHGGADPTVNIANERQTMTDLLACPAPPRRETHWTVIPDGGHNIWDPIYLGTTHDIYGFLLSNPHP